MHIKNFSSDYENDFCDRFKGYRYMATIGNSPFKTAFIVNAVLNVPSSIIATLANILVIISIWRCYSLRTPANMLLIGLALSDLGVGVIVQPFFIAYLISFAKQGTANFTCISTAALTITATFLSCVSFGTVTAISLERYLSLRLHLRYEDLITMKRVRRFLAILWLLGGISPVVWVLFAPSYKSYFLVTGIVLCLVISTVAYVKIYRIARSHLKQIESHKAAKATDKLRNRKKSAFNMFLVYCVLLCCYLPYSICLAVGNITGYTKWNWIAINSALTIVNINSSINPVIYCYRMREIRRAILHTLYTMTLWRTNAT
ncbi:adenosine receptor A2b-like [Oculina patagonica]